MALADPPRFDLIDPSSIVAVWRSVVFTVWGFRPVPLAVAEKHVQAMETLGKSKGIGRIAVVTLFDLDVPVPNAELRGMLEKSVLRVAPYYACSGTVFPGDGFRGALVRGVLSSFQLIAKTKYPHRVFADHDACAQWMAPFLSSAGVSLRGPSELADAMRLVADRARSEGVFGSPT